MAELSLSEQLFMFLLFGVPVILLFLIVIQHILGVVLAKNLDKHFFKPPYFTEGEMSIYSSWPMSALRYATYIVYIAFPPLLHKRRFKGHKSPYIPGNIVKLSCQLWFIGLIMCILSAPIIILIII